MVLPLVYLPYNAVFGVYRLQRISIFRMSARTRTSTISNIPRSVPSIPIAIPRSIPSIVTIVPLMLLHQ